jgi:hypothetical protein
MARTSSDSSSNRAIGSAVVHSIDEKGGETIAVLATCPVCWQGKKVTVKLGWDRVEWVGLTVFDPDEVAFRDLNSFEVRHLKPPFFVVDSQRAHHV